jgi:hypothetical protein
MNEARFNLTQKVGIDDATDDKHLIISGVAADINKDRYNNYLTPETMESLCKQAKNTNLHLNHDENKIIGRNYDAKIENNQLIVKSKILPEYASKLKEELEFGINYAESIKGISTKNIEDGEIVDYDLLEISLTDMPVNQNTYATVQIDDQKSMNADCLGGLCYLLDKEDNKMVENESITLDDVKNVTSEQIKELDDKYVSNDDLNNALNEYKEDMLNTLRDELKGLVSQALLDFKKMEESSTEEKQEEEPIQKVEKEAPVEQKSETEVPLNTTEQVKEVVASSMKEFEDRFFKNMDAKRNPEPKQYVKETDQKSVEKKRLALTPRELAIGIANGDVFNE